LSQHIVSLHAHLPPLEGRPYVKPRRPGIAMLSALFDQR
jgi:hypothetical protein